MAYCTKCGREIKDGEICECVQKGAEIDTSSAKAFFVSMKNRMGIGVPEKNETDCYERGQNIVPINVKPSDGEVPVKQYDVAVLRTRLKFQRAEGRLQVTNKRLIFRATGRSVGGRTTLQHEFAIDELAGIEAKRDYKFSILDFLFGLMLIAAIFYIAIFAIAPIYRSVSAIAVILALLIGGISCYYFFSAYKKFLTKLLLLSVGLGCIGTIHIAKQAAYQSNWFWLTLVIFMSLLTLVDLFVFSFKPNLVLSVKNKGALGAVDIRRKEKGLPGAGNPHGGDTGYSEVLPTEQTETAIREINAMITDIQKLGDFGIEKWKK